MNAYAKNYGTRVVFLLMCCEKCKEVMSLVCKIGTLKQVLEHSISKHFT